MKSAIVLFNRDLRVHDHPALRSAERATVRVVPLFVLDDDILGGGFARPNSIHFLIDCLRDLRAELERRGATLFVRSGDVVEETMRLIQETVAGAVYLSEDYSAFAVRRQNRLARACDRAGARLIACPGVTVVPPGDIAPASGGHFRVFTPYWRRWNLAEKRSPLGAPRSLRVPSGVAKGRIPSPDALVAGKQSPELTAGGENEARKRLGRWLRSALASYEDGHDDLAGNVTSRLSPYLHFGCISPTEVVARAAGREGADPFVRQICWRDFHYQVLAAFPGLPRTDYRTRNDRWHHDTEGFQAWKEGRTGIPIVDAGMRQLAREGYMHNRARLITASFLTKDLYIDWRLGARHFWDLLVDGDIANNSGNWQWVAGTGNDTRPNRMFNPIRQARRFDPKGDYVRRYVAELKGIEGGAVHEPWKLDVSIRKGIDYPEPIVDHAEAVQRFRANRG